MRRGMLALAICAACGGEPKSPPTGPIDLTVTTYDVAFDLTTRHAKATLTATTDAAGNCFTLPFRAHGLANATIDGASAGGELADGLLTMCGDGWDAGTTLTIGAEMDVALATLQGSQVGYSVTP